MSWQKSKNLVLARTKLRMHLKYVTGQPLNILQNRKKAHKVEVGQPRLSGSCHMLKVLKIHYRIFRFFVVTNSNNPSSIILSWIIPKKRSLIMSAISVMCLTIKGAIRTDVDNMVDIIDIIVDMIV